MTPEATTYTEHELAVWLEVAPVFIISWIEHGMLEAERDEIGYLISVVQCARFEEEHGNVVAGAVRLTATTLGFGVGRVTYSRAHDGQQE